MSYRYPYGNTEQMNLDWFLNQWEKFKADWAKAEAGIDGSLDAEIAKVEAAMSELYAARDAAAASATAARQSSLDAAAAQVAAGNSKTAAQAAETSARGSQQAAAESAQEAQASATGAENSALTATQAANTATQQAAGADAAKGAAEAAQQAAEAAQAAAAQSAGQAGQAATAAGDHADDAADSATVAQQAAQDMSDSVAQITTNKNDISVLKESFNASTGNGEIEINLDQAIRCGTSPVNFNDFTGGSDYKHALLDVTPGDKFRITGGSIGMAARLYCFTDDNGVIKENTIANVTVNDLLITAPEGATKLIINYALLSPNPVTAVYGDWLVNDVREVIENNKNLMAATAVYKDDKTVVALTNNDGYFITTNGSVTAYQTGWSVTEQTDISEFESLIISASSGYNHLLYAFYDSNDTFISGENSGSEIKSIEAKSVAIPSNAKYIRISSTSSFQSAALIGISNSRLENNANLEKWNDKTWVVIGDSLTEKNNTALIKYYDYISNDTGISVNVQAHSGTGYANPGITDNFLTRAQTVPIGADVYTIFGSFNDYEYSLTNNIEIGTPTDTGTDTLCGYFNSTIAALISRNPLINIGIVSPCPWVSVNDYNGAGNGFGKQYSDALKAVAARWSIPFLNLYECSGLRPWNANFVAQAYTKDNLMGVHPDETGHKILSTKFKEFLEMLLA